MVPDRKSEEVADVVRDRRATYTIRNPDAVFGLRFGIYHGSHWQLKDSEATLNTVYYGSSEHLFDFNVY